MPSPFNTVRFDMAGLSLEWQGETRELVLLAGNSSSPLAEMISEVIREVACTHASAAVAVNLTGKRLAQRVTNLRAVSPDGEEIPIEIRQ